jgi:adenylosuccinate lyase
VIDRYEDPDIAAVFDETAKINRWHQIELSVARAQAIAGVIPPNAAAIIGGSAAPGAGRVAEHEQTTRHDVAAFLQAWRETNHNDPAFEYAHYGLTSSDLVDTGLGMALLTVSNVLQKRIGAAGSAIGARAIEYGHTDRIGRTHGRWAVPTTLGNKLSDLQAGLIRTGTRFRQAKSSIAVGKVSGPVGRYDHDGISPAIEADVLDFLGLTSLPFTTQVVMRDGIAHWAACLVNALGVCEAFALEIRHSARSEVAEIMEPFGVGQVGSSAMPHKTNPVTAEKICGLVRLARGYLPPLLENVALWHERDISHSSVERVALVDLCHVAATVLGETAGLARGMVVDERQCRLNLEWAQRATRSRPDNLGRYALAPKQG